MVQWSMTKCVDHIKASLGPHVCAYNIQYIHMTMQNVLNTRFLLRRYQPERRPKHFSTGQINRMQGTVTWLLYNTLS